MFYSSSYISPLGKFFLTSNGTALTSLTFATQNMPPFIHSLQQNHTLPIFCTTKAWLNAYFEQQPTPTTPPLHLIGTPFQLAVWQLLFTIPHGSTTTYGHLAQQLAKIQGKARMSAQAIGGAVAKNPIAIIVPCHRVVGVNGHLTGYAGGLNLKQELLTLEKGL